MWESQSGAERHLLKARQQLSQTDINESLNRAIEELRREVKRVSDDVHRLRREIQIERRRSF